MQGTENTWAKISLTLFLSRECTEIFRLRSLQRVTNALNQFYEPSADVLQNGCF